MKLDGGYDWLDRVNRILLLFLIGSTLATTVMVLPSVDWSTATDTARAVRRAFLSSYVMTALLAVCFCIMGAGVMHHDNVGG